MKSLLERMLRGAPGALLPAALALAACADDIEVPGYDAPGAADPEVVDPEGADPEGADPEGADPEVADPEVAETVARRARDTIEGGNSSGVFRCGEAEYQHYERRRAGATQLHVVATYEAASESIAVQVKRAGSTILVLSSYESVHWNVTATTGASLERVIVTSYEASSATVPAGVPVEFHSYDDGEALPGTGATLWPSISASDLADAAEEMTGRQLTSFRACYGSGGFDIEAPRSIQPPHPVSEATERTVLEGCEALTAESTYCLANQFDELVMFGLDSGEVCHGQGIRGPSFFDASLGWQGDYVVACDYERGVVRTSVRDGSTDVAPLACMSVTADESGLVGFVWLVRGNPPIPFGGLARFSFKQAAARQVEHVFDLAPQASRMTVRGDQAYFAWHSTDTVETSELADRAPLTPIRLEGFDDWIQGMDLTDDGRLVIAGGIRGDRILLFDAATGAALGEVPLQEELFLVSGLQCSAGGR